MKNVYFLVNNSDFNRQLKKLTRFPIINNLNEIKEKNATLVIFYEAFENKWFFEQVLTAGTFNHVILIEQSESGLRVSSFSANKIGCPKCMDFYEDKLPLSNKNLLNINILDEIILKILKVSSNKNFQYVLEISKNMKVNLLKLLPSFFCINCKELYRRKFPIHKSTSLKQEGIRKFNDEMVNNLVLSIPVGDYSLFDSPEIYQFKEIYISRVKIKGSYNSYGIGRSFTKENAVNVSLLESLERLSLNGNIGTSNNIMKPYKDLTYAIHPSKLIKTNYVFDESLYYRWVTGLELSTRENVMIPEQLVLIENDITLKNKGENRFYSTTSNGTAIGGSIEEATFFAIKEYLERDYGLKAWYLKENLKRWSLQFFYKNKKIMSLIQFFKENYCDLHIISTSNIKIITTVWVHLSWKNGQLNSLGSGFSPENAVESALLELFTGFLNFKKLNQQQEQRIYHLNKTNQFENMEDHVLYYLQKKVRGQFSFIKSIPYENESKYNALEKWIEEKQSEGLSSLFYSLVEEMKKLDRKIYMVDLTPSILKEIDSNLSVAKVFMTNSYHFNFGFYDNNHNHHPFL
ncbi:YcaO-like family protein [uncultured Metabacillus sp.]|uniref:YcaO-like family protein n=1 Tax=uncultured Metabacillus sp. TaxID=2860135 RepID=UPI002630E34C|nr:YcaO-like family protein [uncultured Metabacillus sp.]